MFNSRDFFYKTGETFTISGLYRLHYPSSSWAGRQFTVLRGDKFSPTATPESFYTLERPRERSFV